MSTRMPLLLSVMLIFLSGCMQQSPFDNPVDSFFGNPTDNLFPPVEEPTEPAEEPNPDAVGENLLPYGVATYDIAEKSAIYEENSGIATFLWRIETDGNPVTHKVVCVEPKQLPEKFWEEYDSGEALLDRNSYDKQWRNLYLPLDMNGEAEFSFKTRVQGEYQFDFCGILDEDYSNQQSHSGDASLSVDVQLQGLVVTGTECEDVSEGMKSHYRICRWHMEFANGTKFGCWVGRPFTDMETTDGQTGEGMFEIKVEKAGVAEYFVVNAPMRICGVGACGCGDGPYITVAVSEETPATISIVKVNEDYYTYTGDGDPIVVTY